MGQMYIEEAFKRLSLLEDDYSYSEDQQLELLNQFVSDDIDDTPEEEIIDVDAESYDDLQDSYVGKIIIECDCCHTRLYKEPEDLVLGSSEDGIELFNLEEECPVCHTNSGYRVIGKIEPYADKEIEQPEEQPEEEPVEEPVEDEVEKEIHEALKEAVEVDKCVAILNKNEFDEEGDTESIAAKIESDYIPGNDELESLDVTCEAQGDNIIFNGPKADIEELYNRMFNDEITPDFVECSSEEPLEEPLEEDVDETIEFNSEEEAKQYYEEHKDELGFDSYEAWVKDDVEKLHEELESVEVITDEGNVKVEKDDEKLVVDLSTDEDLEEEANEGEMIAPITDEEEEEIMATAEDNAAKVAQEEKNDLPMEDDLPVDDLPEEEFEDLPELDEVEEAEIEEEEMPEEEDEMEESYHESLEHDDDSDDELPEDEEDEEPFKESLSDRLLAKLHATPATDELEEECCEEDIELADLEEFNESTFNNICESYLRRVYENVDTFESTAVKHEDDKLVVEGLVKFKSGNTKQSSFEFTNPVVTKRGKVVLEGLNSTFTTTKNAYILKGEVKNGEFISESMIYRYTAKTLNESNQPESIKFYGRVVYNG